MGSRADEAEHFKSTHLRWMERRNRRNESDEYRDEWWAEQCGGCSFWVPLSGVFGGDYGGCSNPVSPFDGSVRFEHDGCEHYDSAGEWAATGPTRMMDSPGPRLAIELVRAVGVLALPPESQTRVLELLGTAPSVDELALEVSDGVSLIPQFLERGWFNDHEATVVAEVDRLLMALTQSRDESQWTIAALHGEEWSRVREVAKRFFSPVES